MADALPCLFQGRVVGYFQSAPAHAVTDVFFRAREALAHGRVMILYIDGLVYSLYRRAALPKIKRRFDCRSAQCISAADAALHGLDAHRRVAG